MANGSEASVGRSRLTLQSLAETLGCSTADFFGETAPERIADAEELLRLWLAFDDTSKRRRVLDFTRSVKSAAESEHDA